MISVRSEVQILPGPPRPNDAKRRSCRPRQAQRELRRERLVQNATNALRAFVASRGSGCSCNRESGLVQKESPDKSAAGAASSLWLGVLFCAVRLSQRKSAAGAAKDFGRQGRPKSWGCSSVGRAPALQAGGHRFDSVHLHHRHERREASFVSSATGATRVAPRAPGAEQSAEPARKRSGKDTGLPHGLSSSRQGF